MRLRSVISDRPKSLAEITGRPLLDILIDYIARQGFKRFLLLAGWQSECIEAYAKQKSQTTGLEIWPVIEPEPLGTGGALNNALDYFHSSTIIVLNGDSFCPVNLPELVQFHETKQAVLTMVLSLQPEAGEYGEVCLDPNSRITAFAEKKNAGLGSGVVNAGIYVFAKNIIKQIPRHCFSSLEQDVFPQLVGKAFFGFPVKRPHFDIGTPQRYFYAQAMLPALLASLDRN